VKLNTKQIGASLSLTRAGHISGLPENPELSGSLETRNKLVAPPMSYWGFIKSWRNVCGFFYNSKSSNL